MEDGLAMSARILTAIAFKVFAIYFCLQVILQIPSIWSIYETLGPWKYPSGIISFLPYLVASVLVLVGFLISLIIYKLGSSVLNSVPVEIEKPEVDRIEVVLFQLLGVYFVITSLTLLPSKFILATFDSIHDLGRPSLLALRFEVAANFIKLLVGCALIAKATVWQSLFYKLRYMGNPPSNE